MRNKRWIIPFKTLKGNDAVVGIYQEGYSGAVTSLTPAANPFSTQEDNDDDPFLPVRGQSGYIRIIDESGVAKDMVPADYMSNYVELTVNGVVKWCGYMQSAQFSADWDSLPLEVEFPVMSGLAVLESMNIEAGSEMGLQPMGQLLLDAISAVKVDYSEIYVPVEFYSRSVSAASLPLMCAVSKFNWFEDNRDKNTDEADYQEYIGITYKEALEEWMKLWGWTLCERGKSLFFVSNNVANYDILTMADVRALMGGSNVYGQTVSARSLAIESLDVDGDQNTIDLIQGKRNVIVEAQVNQVGDVLPDIKSARVRRDFYYIYPGGRVVAFKYLIPLSHQYIFWRWEISADGSVYGHMEELTENDNVLVYAGGESVRWQNLAGAELLDVDDEYQDNQDKYNIDFTRRIRVNRKQYTQDPATTRELYNSNGRSVIPMCIMRSKKAVQYNEGAFVINGNVGFQIENKTYGVFPTKIGEDATIELRLQVGDKYWDGAQWVDDYCSFFVGLVPSDGDSHTEWHAIKNTKTIDQVLYNGASGYLIKIDTQISGEMELTIAQGVKYSLHYKRVGYDGTEEQGDGNSNIIQIKDLRIEYVAPEDIVAMDKKDDKNIYQMAAGRFLDDYKVDLSINTDDGNGAAYSSVTLGNDNLTEVGSVSWGNIRPEMALVKTLKRVYGNSIEKLSVQFEIIDAKPIDRIVCDGKDYRLMAEAVDWVDDSGNYQIAGVYED